MPSSNLHGMAASREITLDTLLADLTPRMANDIIQKLQFNHNWEHAAAALTRHDRTTLMFDTVQINLMEQNGTKAARHMFKSLLTENYTLQWLLDIMIETELYIVADYITMDILHGELVRKAPELNHVPQASENDSASDVSHHMGYVSGVPTGCVELEGAVGGESTDSQTMTTFVCIEGELHRFPHRQLEQITDYFNQTPLSKGGRLIGEGGYGHVFYGQVLTGEAVYFKLAIKRLHRNNKKDFHTEIKTMSGVRHENILQLLGYSDDEDCNCIVYPYMTNGSLEDYLARKVNPSPLSVAQRLDIAIGLAKGIHHLHTGDPPLIHRDIKSANVLLDDMLVPKLGDFGIARICPTLGREEQTSTQTQVIRGTRVYIAPETFQSGKLSPKSDIYSFGVILYELLTGLKAFDETRKENSLSVLIYEECGDDLRSVMGMVDQRVSAWTESVVDSLFSLGQRCLNYRPRERPDLSHVIEELELSKRKYTNAG